MTTEVEPVPPPAPPTLPDYVSVPFQPLHAKLFRRVFKLILDKALFFNGDQQRKESPYKFQNPNVLKVEFNFTLTKDGNSQETIFEALEKLIRFSPHLSHPFYLDKRRTAIDPYGIMADFVAAVLSTAVVTYFFAPVFTLMEEEVKREVRKLIGYSELKGDGLICPGSAFSTHLALRMCLEKKYPDLRTKGIAGIGKPKFCIFQSEHHSRYLEKAAVVLGLGSDACIRVKTDSLGRMDVAELKIAYKKAKASNLIPIFVQAQAGTLLLGAIDPIDEIANFCAQKKLWFHVDAASGGAYLLYDEGKARLKGIEKSDSVSWSPTELLAAPFCITVLLTKYEKLCIQTFGFHANILFEPTDLYDPSYDNGDATIQTSRRPEIFKLWFMWKVKGKRTLGRHVEYCDNLSKFAVAEIQKRSGNLKLLLPAYDTPRVAFQFIPPKDYHGFSVGDINRKLKEELLTRGKVVVGLSKLAGQQNFLSILFTNSALSPLDVTYILDEIVYVGKKITMPLVFDLLGREEPKVPKALTTFEDFVSIPIVSQHKSLFKKTMELINGEGLYFQDKRGETCYNFRTPMDLLQQFDFELGDGPVTGEDQIMKILEQTIFYSIHQAHPYYVYQLLSGGLDPYGIIGDFMLTTMTTNMLTYENAPVYTLMEEELFKVSRKRIGYPIGGDGLLCPGGSISIISAIHVAKVSKYPEIRAKGLTLEVPKRLVMYISRNAHYCSNKGCSLQGIGLDNCVSVDTDDKGRMSIQALRVAIEKTLSEGGTPFFVLGTAGTTVLGSVDPLNEIADVCVKYNLWFHVDGSIGGSMMMSDKYKAKYLRGTERSDSFNYNPHKLYGVVQETSIVLFRRKNDVRAAFGFKDPYGNPKSTLYNTSKYDHDGARGGLQSSSRRPDVLKFWLLWKKKGYKGMGDEVEYMYTLKNFMLQELSRRSDRFVPIVEDFDVPNVCFYYLPISLRGVDRKTPEFKTRANKVGVPLAKKITLAGRMITGCLEDPDRNVFLKFILFNSGVTFNDIKYMLDEIDFQGKDMDA